LAACSCSCRITPCGQGLSEPDLAGTSATHIPWEFWVFTTFIGLIGLGVCMFAVTTLLQP
jgi:hypothetical protein